MAVVKKGSAPKPVKKYEDSPLDDKMDKTMQKVINAKGAARQKDAAPAIATIKKVAAGPTPRKKG